MKKVNHLQTEPVPSQKRSVFLDYLRGFVMILVLLQHANGPFSNWILLFNMPLFFLLSGYIEGIVSRTEAFSVFLWKKVRRLLLPYLLFELLNLLLWTALQGAYGIRVDIGSALLSIILCSNSMGYMGFYGRLWFWPCLFISELAIYWICRLSREEWYRTWIFVAILLSLSWWSYKINTVRLPFMLDTAFLATAYVAAGYGLKEQVSQIIGNRTLWKDCILFAASALLLWTSSCMGASCLMFVNQYGPLLWTVLAGLSGSLCTMLFAKFLYIYVCKEKSGKSLILWYGKNSLAVFPVHLFIKTVLVDILVYYLAYSGVGIFMRVSEYVNNWYLVFPAMLIGCVPAVKLLTAAAPWMVGKFPSRGQKRADIDKKGIIG